MDPEGRRLMHEGLTLAVLLLASAPVLAAEPDIARQKSLIHLVRQDCGSCHGLTLQGGLGPALTAARLKDWTPADLAATIIQGRPGTPMPPFKGILDEDEAHWIARQLLAGFPEGR